MSDNQSNIVLVRIFLLKHLNHRKILIQKLKSKNVLLLSSQKAKCNTIIEYKKGKSTDDWIYEIGSTKTAACPTGDLRDICIKVHKV